MPETQETLAWYPVKSSNLAAVAYDRATSTLYVKFQSGATWSYPGVPEEVYTTLIISPSVGRYFARAVKGRYGGSRVG